MPRQKALYTSAPNQMRGQLLEMLIPMQWGDDTRCFNKQSELTQKRRVVAGDFTIFLRCGHLTSRVQPHRQRDESARIKSRDFSAATNLCSRVGRGAWIKKM